VYRVAEAPSPATPARLASRQPDVPGKPRGSALRLNPLLDGKG